MKTLTSSDTSVDLTINKLTEEMFNDLKGRQNGLDENQLYVVTEDPYMVLGQGSGATIRDIHAEEIDNTKLKSLIFNRLTKDKFDQLSSHSSDEIWFIQDSELSGQPIVVDTRPVVLPTKLSELSNDVGYCTSAYVTSRGYATESWVNNKNYATQSYVQSYVADHASKTTWTTWRMPSDPYLHQPFTVRATQANSSVKLYKHGSPPSNSFEYSTDNGTTWSAYTLDTSISMPNIGDTVMFRNTSNSTQLATYYSRCHRFAGTGEWAVEGNIDSLLNKDFDTTTTTYGQYAMGSLFEGDSNYCVRDASNLIFPDHPLAAECYRGTFWDTHLVKGPQLRATTLVATCYAGMFSTSGYLTEVKLFYTGDLNGNPAFTGADPWMVGTLSPTGTFYYNGTDTTRGPTAIPTGWDIVQF